MTTDNPHALGAALDAFAEIFNDEMTTRHLAGQFTDAEAHIVADVLREAGHPEVADGWLKVHAAEERPDVWLKLSIVNAYADGHEETTTASVTVPAPQEGEELHDWAAEHLMEFTGTGRDGDALYEITITEANEVAADLVGKVFEFQG